MCLVKFKKLCRDWIQQMLKCELQEVFVLVSKEGCHCSTPYPTKKTPWPECQRDDIEGPLPRPVRSLDVHPSSTTQIAPQIHAARPSAPSAKSFLLTGSRLLRKGSPASRRSSGPSSFPIPWPDVLLPFVHATANQKTLGTVNSYHIVSCQWRLAGKGHGG